MFDEGCHFYLTVKVGYELWLTSEFRYGSFLSQRNVNWKVFLGMVPRFPTWPRGDKLNFLEGNFEFPQAPGGIYKGLGPNAGSTTSCSRLSSSYIIWWEISHEKIWFLMKRISETLFPIFFSKGLISNIYKCFSQRIKSVLRWNWNICFLYKQKETINEKKCERYLT